MMKFCVLSSGSKANCTYIEAGSTKLLVDCGLSARETTRRLALIGVEAREIQAIVVSHEHSDHVTGIPNFVKRFGCRVLSNAATRENSAELQSVPFTHFEEFSAGDPFDQGELRIIPFSIAHDAADPVAFRVECGRSRLGIVTDLGQVTELVRDRVRDLDALVVESNHDLELLQGAPYPWSLKQRIRSRFGHLSNESAGELLVELHVPGGRPLRNVVAAHISENSNKPELALGALRAAWQRLDAGYLPSFEAASIYGPTSLYQI